MLFRSGGHPGVPYVVGRSGKQVYGSTSQQFPLIISAAPAEGLYRANLFFSTKNPTGGIEVYLLLRVPGQFYRIVHHRLLRAAERWHRQRGPIPDRHTDQRRWQ